MSPKSSILPLSAHPFRQVELIRKLGHGAYGTIYLGKAFSPEPSVETNEEYYAIKYLQSDNLSPFQKRLQRMEAHLHYKCKGHPNICTLHSVYLDPLAPQDGWYMVLEHATGGDLFDYICQGGVQKLAQDRGTGVEHVVREIFQQVLEAITHCHSKGVYHRDIKPENLLITSIDEHQSIVVKLTDFGLATEERFSLDRGCGSSFYMSPECLQLQATGAITSSASSGSSYESVNAPYDTAGCDVWSLGILLVNLACRRNPWHRADPLLDSAFAHYLEHREQCLLELLPITPEFARLLSRILDPNPATRPKLAQLAPMIQQCEHFLRSTSPPSPISGESSITTNITKTAAAGESEEEEEEETDNFSIGSLRIHLSNIELSPLPGPAKRTSPPSATTTTTMETTSPQ